jgi:hypothetical protein
MSKFLLCLVLSAVSSSAFAIEYASAQASAFIGGVAGFSVPDYEDTSARPMFGIVGGAKLSGEWGLGGYYLTASKEESMDPLGTGLNSDMDFNYALYGLQAMYYLEGIADNAYLAARIGMAKVKVDDENFSPLAWGFHFGYDFPIRDFLTLGLEAGFMSVQGEDKSAITDIDLDSMTMINLLAAAKFWF